MTESKDLKDGQYNDTNKKDDPMAPRSAVCGIVAIPGLELRSKTSFAVCECGHQGPTDVDAFWSVKNYLYCYYCAQYWSCYQLVKGKDWTLKDAVHKCGSCKKVLAEYTAC